MCAFTYTVLESVFAFEFNEEGAYMAAFTNTAMLTYNNQTRNSNVVTGEILEVLTATKNVIGANYRVDDTLTYVVTVVNSGATAITGLTLSDDLGAYTFGTGTLTPLDYVEDSLRYYTNGTLATTPTVTAGPPLTVAGISVPAGGDATIIYQAKVNEFAPLTNESSVKNTATVTGGAQTLMAEATIAVSAEPELTITKTLCPQTVVEDGQITYTFVIQNTGNTAAVAADNVTVTDTFTPILKNIAVTLDGTALATPADYSYSETTGVFTTTAGRITVPAATYTQNTDGSFTVTPGTATLVVTGTI